MRRIVLATLGCLAMLTVTSQAHAAGVTAWTWGRARPIDAPMTIDQIACPDAQLCVATDSSGHILTTHDPLSASSRWTRASVATYALGDLACPSATLCVAVGGDGVEVSTDPSGGASAWRPTEVDPGDGLSAIACPSTGLCVATDDNAGVVSTTDPAGPSSGWTRTVLAAQEPQQCGKYFMTCPAPLPSVSCPAVTLCVAMDDDGDTFVTSDAGASWSSGATAPIGAGYTGGAGVIACPAVNLCVTETGMYYEWEVATTTDPTDPTSLAWNAYGTEFDPDPVSCPRVDLCLAGNRVSTDPAAGTGSWRVANLYGQIPVYDAACPTATACIAVAGGAVIVGTPAHAPTFAGRRPSITGTARVGALLQASPGRFDGSGRLYYAYQWQRCDRGCVSIVNAQSNTLRLRRGDRGARIRVQVTAINIAGQSQPASSARSARVRPRRR